MREASGLIMGVRRIHLSERKEKETKRLQRKREAENAEKIGRYTIYLVVLIVAAFGWFISEINFINYYSYMSEFRENAGLVTAKLVNAENYEKVTRGKNSRYKPAGTKDLTLQFELNGQEIVQTYENVYVLSSEANMDKYTHIKVYVLEDASDVQTSWVIEDCMEEAKFRFTVGPMIVFGICLALMISAERNIFGETKKR